MLRPGPILDQPLLDQPPRSHFQTSLQIHATNSTKRVKRYGPFLPKSLTKCLTTTTASRPTLSITTADPQSRKPLPTSVGSKPVNQHQSKCLTCLLQQKNGFYRWSLKQICQTTSFLGSRSTPDASCFHTGSSAVVLTPEQPRMSPVNSMTLMGGVRTCAMASSTFAPENWPSRTRTSRCLDRQRPHVHGY